jgi:hypothetical protein
MINAEDFMVLAAKQIELFCVAHKPPPLILPEGTKVIGVSGFMGGDFSDAMGVNQISAKNSRMCELTAIYWLLKNHDFTTSHVGVCHYRRLWSDSRFFPNYLQARDNPVCSNSDGGCQDFVSSLEELSAALYTKHVDILLPDATNLGISVAQHYQLAHDINDLLLVFNVAINKGYISNAFAHYFLEQPDMFSYNMGILPTEYFIQTWSKVLDVIFAIEDQIPDKEDVYQDRLLPMLRTQAYQNRVFGFLSERLFSAFVMSDLWKPNPVLRASTRAVMMVID